MIPWANGGSRPKTKACISSRDKISILQDFLVPVPLLQHTYSLKEGAESTIRIFYMWQKIFHSQLLKKAVSCTQFVTVPEVKETFLQIVQNTRAICQSYGN